MNAAHKEVQHTRTRQRHRDEKRRKEATEGKKCFFFFAVFARFTIHSKEFSIHSLLLLLPKTFEFHLAASNFTVASKENQFKSVFKHYNEQMGRAKMSKRRSISLAFEPEKNENDENELTIVQD